MIYLKNAYVCDCDVIHSDAVSLAKKNMPDEKTLSDIAALYKVLGDETRVRIVSALDNSSLCVCDLASLLSMTKSAISHQLKILKDAKLVKYRREAKNVFYSLDDDHIKAIFELGLQHVNERK